MESGLPIIQALVFTANSSVERVDFDNPTTQSHEKCPQGLLLAGSAEGFG
jgi:hypothetical protein